MHTFLTVTQHPGNDTFCEGSNAVLSCVIFDNSTNDAAADIINWFYANNLTAVSNAVISNSRVHDVVTSKLTIQSVSLDDNDIGCFCSPTAKFGVKSYVGVISIAGIHKHYLPTYIRMYVYIIRDRRLLQWSYWKNI